MPRKIVPGLDGKIIVDLPDDLKDYEVFGKKIPDKLTGHPDYSSCTWVGNFGFKDDTGKDVKGRLPKRYDVLVEEISDKDKLCYWNGRTIVKVHQNGQRVPIDGRNYGKASLYLGDPPVGWA